jgi:ribosome-associated protein
MSNNPQEEISKTQLKKQSKDITSFGQAITLLNRNQLEQLNLPSDINNAIEDYKKIKSLSAKKRQLLFIGRLLRSTDLHEAFIQYEAIKNHSQLANQQFHLVEQWRDKLIQSPDAITEFINQFPKTDVQQLRSLIKNSINEIEKNKPLKSSRSLFKIIQSILNN